MISTFSTTTAVWANFTAATVSSPDEIRDTLTHQVTGTVRWAETIAALLAQGHRTFIEFGLLRRMPHLLLRCALQRRPPESPARGLMKP